MNAEPTGVKMSGHVKDIRGRKFGRLTVVSYVGRDEKTRAARWMCLCECGTNKIVDYWSLKSGETASCGCLYRETRGRISLTHGRTKTPEYGIWKMMRRRCYDQAFHKHKDYGARGIKVCDRWKDSFENFFADMGERPLRAHSLDRIDNDKDYSPENCRWATAREQAANRRTSIVLEFNGDKMCIKQWADKLGMAACTIQYRVNQGWPIEKILAPRQRKRAWDLRPAPFDQKAYLAD